MIKITVIVLAGLKEKYLRDAAAEYQKRLRAYCDLKIVELEPVRLSEKPSQKEIAAALEREAAEMERYIPKNTVLTALCIEGKQQSSEEFAADLLSSCAMGESMTFLVGSSYGLAESLKARCAKRLSFSKMTFPHQLFRVMLFEQLYRAFQINSGGAYHK